MLKLATGSKGRGVVPIDSEPRLRAVIDLIRVVAPDRTFLVQDRLGVPGVDIRVFVLGHKAIAAMKRQSTNGEECANFSLGGEVNAFPLTPKIIDLSEKISRIFSVEIAGVDLLVVGDEFALIEVNGSPGFEGLCLATGIDIAEQIAGYVATRISGDLA
jgi:RimK family alpha-L-glutamate ligase